MGTQDDVQTLRDLGLSSTQAIVYLSLVRIGRSTARTISRNSNIARPDVYRTMIALQYMGLVEKAITVPLSYKAIPIEEGTLNLLSRKTKEHLELTRKTRKLAQKYKMKNEETTCLTDEPQFILIPAQERAIERRKELIANAQTGIDVISSWKRFPRFTSVFSEEIKKALKRGVKFRMVIEKTENGTFPKTLEEIEDIRKNASFKVKYLFTHPKAVVSIYDKKEVLIVTLSKANLGESPTLWSNNPSLIAMIIDHFELLWTVAEKNTTTK